MNKKQVFIYSFISLIIIWLITLFIFKQNGWITGDENTSSESNSYEKELKEKWISEERLKEVKKIEEIVPEHREFKTYGDGTFDFNSDTYEPEEMDKVNEILNKEYIENQNSKQFPDLPESISSMILNWKIRNNNDCNKYTRYKYYCLTQLTQRYKYLNPEFCKNFSKVDEKDSCFFDVSRTLKNKKYCEDIKDESKKSLCLN